MNSLEDEYFFICKNPDRPDLPFLKADEATVDRSYNVAAAPLGQAPFKFTNAWREKRRKEGLSTIVPPVMFNGSDLVIEDKHRMRLVQHGDIPNLHICPAIYIDDDDKPHENYWFLTFTDSLDCWDRNTSDFNRSGGVLSGGQMYFNVRSYKFNADLMNRTPIEKRLLFKMGGSVDGQIVAHASVVLKFFGQPGVNGAEYIKVSDD